MDNNLLAYILQNLNKDIHSISITGGEALLFWDDIKYLLLLNNSAKISIVTNGFWGYSFNAALKFCNEMKMYNIQQLELSSDKYHEAYIPFQNILNIANAANLTNIKIKLIMCTEIDKDDYLFIKSYGKLFAITKNREDIIVQAIANYGNAKKRGENTLIKKNDFIGKKCFQIMNPCINYNGDVFSCCGPYIIFGKKTPFYYGNMQIDNIHKIFSAIKNDKRLLAVRKYGPYNYLLLQGIDVTILNFSSLCELCEYSMRL